MLERLMGSVVVAAAGGGSAYRSGVGGPSTFDARVGAALCVGLESTPFDECSSLLPKCGEFCCRYEDEDLQGRKVAPVRGWSTRTPEAPIHEDDDWPIFYNLPLLQDVNG